MNRPLMHVLATTMLGAALGGCGNSIPESAEPDPGRDVTFDLAAMRSEIASRNRAFTNAHVIGDSAAMINIFAEDARVLPPNAGPVIGRRAIAELNAQYLAAGITEFREETVAFYGNEELLIDEGTYVMVYGQTTEKGKYVNIWRNYNGEWKLYSNIWNSSTP